MKQKIIIIIILFSVLGNFSFARGASSVDVKEEEALFVARRAMEDNFYDLALTLLGRFTDKFPESVLRKDAEFYTGQCYFYQKKYPLALAQFKKLKDNAIAISIRDKLYYWSAEVYFKVGDFKQARAFYEELISEYPKSAYFPHAFYSLGWCLFGEGKFQEAKDKFLEFKNKFPQNPLAEEAAFKVAECLYNLKNYSELKEYLEAFRKGYPKTSKLAYLEFYLAESYFYTEDYGLAVTNYAKCLGRDASDKNLAILAYLGLGYSYLKSGDFTNSASNFNKVINSSSDKRNIESALLGKASLFMLGSQFKEAVSSYADLLAKNPGGTVAVEACLGKAEALYNLSSYGEALLAYKEAQEAVNADLPVKVELPERFVEEKATWSDKTGAEVLSGEHNLGARSKDDGQARRADRLYYGLALTYLKLGNFDEASVNISQLISQSKDEELKVSSLIRKADAYLEVRDIEKAKEAYESVLRDYPDSKSCDYARYSLGMCFFNLKEYTRAIAVFKETINQYPESKVLEDACFYLATAYFESGDFQNSVLELNGFTQNYPQSRFIIRAFLLKGLSLKSLSRFPEAQDAFKSILRSAGSDPRLIARAEFEVADCLYYIGRTEEAVIKFDSLRSKYTDAEISPQVLWRLAEHYFKENNFDLCKRYLLGITQGYPQSSLLNDTYYMLGLCLEKQGLFGEALAAFSKVKSKDADVFPRIAGAYKALEDYPNAINYFRKSLDLKKIDKPLMQFKLAECFEESGDLTQALFEYSKVEKGSALGARALLRRAQIAEDEEDWEKAVDLYKQISEGEEAKFAQDRISIIRDRYLKTKN